MSAQTPIGSRPTSILTHEPSEQTQRDIALLQGLDGMFTSYLSFEERRALDRLCVVGLAYRRLVAVIPGAVLQQLFLKESNHERHD